MVSFLSSKFEVIESPKYAVKEIDQKLLEETRMANKLKIAQTVGGSSSFQVIVFNPDSTEIKASERICICETYKSNYGTIVYNYCIQLLYTRQVTNLKETSLRSSVCNAEAAEIDDTSINNSDFLLEGSICTVAAAEKSPNTVWFIHIDSQSTATEDLTDEYGVKVGAGQMFYMGSFLEQLSAVKSGIYCKKMKKRASFFKESVLYPFVNLELKADRRYFITCKDFFDILCYVEHFAVTSIYVLRY